MPINDANHKYKSLWKYHFHFHLIARACVWVCVCVRAAGATKMCEVESYWFPFFMSLNQYKKE